MEKISGILPSSSRVASVDMKETAPVRPGVPSFGRPEGNSSLRADTDFDTAPKTAAIHQQQMDWRSRDQRAAATATKVSDGFFMKNNTTVDPREEAEEMAPTPPRTALAALTQSKPAGFKTDELGSLRGASVRQPLFEHELPEEGEEPILHQPQGLFPKGSFIDRRA